VISITELKKERVRLYSEYIYDIVIEVSQSNYWRRLLFSSDYDQKFLINSDSEFHSPKFIRPVLLEHNLRFYVSKVSECPEEFDEGLVIFKFEPLEFPEIIHYSGNNPDVF